MPRRNEAQSYCIDGDIKIVAGEIVGAATAFLHAHIADAVSAKEYLTSIADEYREALLAVLQKWVDDDTKANLPPVASPDQIWEFIFCLQPEEVTSCFSRIDRLFLEERYQQIVDCCTAILKQCPLDTVPLLLQRGLARVLLGGQEKEAIADYLRAFLKNSDVTFSVVEQQQRRHLNKIKMLMNNCVHSRAPSRSDAKSFKLWVGLTIDCCRFLLTFEPNHFQLQMTYVRRLLEVHRCDRAIAMLSEILERLLKEEELDPEKIAETYLRRASSYLDKQDSANAISDITKGLNARFDCLLKSKMGESPGCADEVNILLRHNETTAKLAADIFGENGKSASDVVALLEKNAGKMTQDDRFKAAVKLETIRECIDLHRATLVLQPLNKDVCFKLASCYAKYGKGDIAIALFNTLLEPPHDPFNPLILAARANCHREIGNREEAIKDYDVLLHHNPRDITLLCERAMVYMKGDDVTSAVKDLLVACSINQKSVVTQMNREGLAQRTRTRQALFEYAKNKLQIPNRSDDINEDSPSVALGIAQLLTRLNPADHACHILMAHAMFRSGCSNDAETKLNKMLQEKMQGIDEHVIKLHLGIIKLFTGRRDEGMINMIEILTNRGERVFASILRDIPLPERARLSEESHQFGINILKRSRDVNTVKQAASSFTIAILFCRDSDLVLEGRNDGTGFHRSYLARAECMAHLGEQRAAILDFSAAIEIYPRCVDGRCGRAFMRLALGHEAECVNDVTAACDLDLENVIAHINALPEQAKKLLLMWINHRVVAMLLHYGYRANDRINTGGSASTISMLDETPFRSNGDNLRTSSISSLSSQATATNPQASNDVTQKKNLHKSEARGISDPIVALNSESAPFERRLSSSSDTSHPSSASTSQSGSAATSQPSSAATSQPSSAATSQPSSAATSQPSSAATSQPSSAATSQPSSAATSQPSSAATSQPSSAATSQPSSAATSQPSSAATSQPSSAGTSQPSSAATSQPSSAATSQPSSAATSQMNNASQSHRNSSATSQLNNASTSLPSSAYTSHPSSATSSIPSSAATSLPSSAATSFPVYDYLYNVSEQEEIIDRAEVLGNLLIHIDGSNATWQGMFADILIVKGDYDNALRHLQAVIELMPSDVTATARAGLINVKLDRYQVACQLLSSLANVDKSGLKYVLKGLDAARRRRLNQEAFDYAEAMDRESKYAASRDCYTLSLLADSHMKLESLRMRSKCHSKLGNTTKAIADISEVIKELAQKPQAHDYCYRASLYLNNNKEFQACRDFMKGISINRDQARSLIHVRPGRSILCSVFYKQASVAFSRHNYEECASMCDVALLIDDANVEMRKLRARAKREISKCVIQ